MPEPHARRAATRLVLTLAVLAPLIAAVLGPLTTRGLELPLVCGDLAFSTEEDFVTANGEYISDGDLLGLDKSGGIPSANCVICATNLDLVGGFDVTVDLGLDAADVADVDSSLVVFSTELDSPNVNAGAPQFTAGDLLATNGTIIPNVALTHNFGAGYDLGLDAAHLVGDVGQILAFLADAATLSRDAWLRDPGRLAALLEEYAVDIWFSTEGTYTALQGQGFIDGDLLSARAGAIVARNEDLLDPAVPAGLSGTGVDFGLDAVSGDRTAETQGIQFSTDILYAGRPAFSDGDILRFGNGVVATNEDLTKCFGPPAGFLGLDALHVTSEAVLKSYLPLILKEHGIPR